jgi:nucleoside-diphosphate-sugar epimerase
MKTIVVTGYTGFVGVNLTPHLVQLGYDVIGLGRTKADNASFVQCTYNEFAEDRNYDVMVHLAGKAHDLKKTVDEKSYFDVNTDLTIRLFEQFLVSAATLFIYISSVKAAADTVMDVLFETDKPNPKTAYGQSKLKAEEYLISSALPIGKRMVILRPCMIHGPGNKGNLNLLYQFVKKGIPYPLAAFENKRSLLSVNNLLFVLTAIITQPGFESGIYNVADDEPLSTTDIINVLANTLKKNAVKWHVNPRVIRCAAAIGDKLHLPLNSERLKKLTESYMVSNQKIKSALGISRMPVTAREGLHFTAINL